MFIYVCIYIYIYRERERERKREREKERESEREKRSVCVSAKLLQSYLTLCNPMDSSPPSSSVHGIPQTRILE